MLLVKLCTSHNSAVCNVWLFLQKIPLYMVCLHFCGIIFLTFPLLSILSILIFCLLYVLEIFFINCFSLDLVYEIVCSLKKWHRYNSVKEFIPNVKINPNLTDLRELGKALLKDSSLQIYFKCLSSKVAQLKNVNRTPAEFPLPCVVKGRSEVRHKELCPLHPQGVICHWCTTWPNNRNQDPATYSWVHLYLNELKSGPWRACTLPCLVQHYLQ